VHRASCAVPSPRKHRNRKQLCRAHWVFENALSKGEIPSEKALTLTLDCVTVATPMF